MLNAKSKHLAFNLKEIKTEGCLTWLIISNLFVRAYVLISTSDSWEALVFMQFGELNGQPALNKREENVGQLTFPT